MDDYYYNNMQNVLDYIKMAKPYNGQILIDQLDSHLTSGSTVLELGMGPGKDLDILRKKYEVTGTELSSVFLELYRKKNPDIDLILLDAKYPVIDRKFDCIYSNKVLHHLTTDELHLSLQKQKEILNPDGIVLHSFWEGDRKEVLSGLTFIYYQAENLREIFANYYEIIEVNSYSEVYPKDSILVMGRKNEYK